MGVLRGARLSLANAWAQVCALDQAAVRILARPRRPPFGQHKSRLIGRRDAIEACTARQPIERSAACGFGARTRVGQDPLQRAEYEIMNAPRIAKAHLELLRMCIDVDGGGVQLQIQQIGRESAVEQHVLIGQPHRAREQLVAHESAIEKSELQVRLAARKRRQCQPSRQPQALGVMFQLDDVAGKVLAAYFGHTRQTLRGGVRRRQRPYRLAVVRQRKGDVEPRQRQAFQHAHDVLIFGGLGAQKLAPCRHVEK